MSGRNSGAAPIHPPRASVDGVRERKRAPPAGRGPPETAEEFRTLLDNLPGAVFRRVRRYDGTTAYTYVSRPIRDMFGIDPDLLLHDSKLLSELIHPDDRQRFSDAVERSARELSAVEEKLRFKTPDGETRWLQAVSRPRKLANGDIQWDGILLDITELNDLETRLAHHDLLTGLPNRVFFVDWLAHLLAQAKVFNTAAAVMAIELRSLKDIRDSSGHGAGDAAIHETAKRLRSAIQDGDMLTHCGGGEFLVGVMAFGSEADFTEPVREILRRLEPQLELDRKEFALNISMGISVFPHDGTNAEALIGNAGAALNDAKNTLALPYQFYTAEMTERTALRLIVEAELRHAIERQELVLFYQPVVATQTLKITGVEALIRWRHPERGLIPPARFIPIAEATGLISPLGEFALRQACTQARQWQRDGTAVIPMSVNLSVWQLLQEDIADRVLAILAETGFPPEELKLEITESAILHDVGATTRAMRRLHDAGIRFSVDDFGIEHSALSLLSRLPIETIKIDYSFVSQMTKDTAHAALVQAIISMTHAMGKVAVAEGVETHQQATYLQAYQCDGLQGFLFSRPVPAEEFVVLLERGTFDRDANLASLS